MLFAVVTTSFVVFLSPHPLPHWLVVVVVPVHIRGKVAGSRVVENCSQIQALASLGLQLDQLLARSDRGVDLWSA